MTLVARVLLLVLWIGPASAVTKEQGLQWYKQGDYQQAHDAWLALSDAGDARATFYLSQLYAQGKGVEQDLHQALDYLVSAAEQGDSLAQFNLGNHYYQGKWVAQSVAQAERWWLAAAEQGLGEAQQNLGALYMKGLGGKQDLPLAWYWLERAASNGSVASRKRLATLENRLEAQMQQVVSSKPGTKSPPPRTQKPPRKIKQPARAVKQPPPVSPKQQVQKPVEPVAGQGNAMGRAWVLRQPGDSYTLQLIASASADAVARLRDGHKWKRQIAVYRFSNKGQQFTVMVYGRFPSLEAARAAIDELPPRLRRSPPWPRRFSDIQRLIR